MKDRYNELLNKIKKAKTECKEAKISLENIVVVADIKYYNDIPDKIEGIKIIKRDMPIRDVVEFSRADKSEVDNVIAKAVADNLLKNSPPANLY